MLIRRDYVVLGRLLTLTEPFISEKEEQLVLVVVPSTKRTKDLLRGENRSTDVSTELVPVEEGTRNRLSGVAVDSVVVKPTEFAPKAELRLKAYKVP